MQKQQSARGQHLLHLDLLWALCHTNMIVMGVASVGSHESLRVTMPYEYDRVMGVASVGSHESVRFEKEMIQSQ